jgi:hypothetical protein
MSLADKGWGMPSSPAGVKTSIEYMKSSIITVKWCSNAEKTG